MNGTTKRSELIRMVRCEPCIKSSLQRIAQAVMYNPVMISENNQPIKEKLQKILNKNLETFLYGCIEMAHVCGFVAFYVKKHKGVPVFRTVPLGLFSWHSALEHDPKSLDVMKYEIQYFGGNIKQEDIYIYNFVPPCSVQSNGDVSSPLDVVFDYYCQKEIQLKTVIESEKWNMQKHVAITEKIDLKDPTTTGLALLDDLRMYNLTGQHTNMATHRLLTKTPQEQSNNAAHGTFQWVKSVFADKYGNAAAQTHVLPPNTDLHELSSIEYSSLYEFMSAQFDQSVFMYFDLAPIGMSRLNTKTAESQTSRFQQNKIEATGRFCQKVVEYAYSIAFDVPIEHVECKIKPMPRLQLESIDDIKTLTEAGIMNPQDRMRTRGMFMER